MSTPDLSVLDVISDRSLLKGTNYFELHPNEVDKTNPCWLDGSIFIRDEGFDFFAACFERSVPDFDYFGFTRVVHPHLGGLAADLRTFVYLCKAKPDRKILFSRYSSVLDDRIWRDAETEQLRGRIIAGGKELERFINAASKRRGVIWIMGM
jgi:hypothetical protein